MVTSSEHLPDTKEACVTIGNFDGVHRGHQKLIHRTLEVCQERNLHCVVVTFSPHPRAFFSGKAMPPLADSQTRRQRIADLGADCLLELNFDKEMASLSTLEFLQRYLYPLHLRALVIGYDFRLGKGRSGDFETLKSIGEKDGFTVEKVDPLLYGDSPISSTRLRSIINDGDMFLASELLGHPYGFHGLVVHGDGRGSKIGIPTANLDIPSVQTPPDGVYATRIFYKEACYPAVTNIGFKPTFGGNQRTIESFLLDCDLNLYGEDIRLEFLARLRDERKFPSPQALVNQIQQDIQDAHSFYDRFAQA